MSSKSQASWLRPVFKVAKVYNSLGCATRSCGPPKPGRRLLNRVYGAAGGPPGARWVPTGEGPWGRRRVLCGTVHQLCTNMGQSSDPSAIRRGILPSCRRPPGSEAVRQASRDAKGTFASVGATRHSCDCEQLMWHITYIIIISSINLHK